MDLLAWSACSPSTLTMQLLIPLKPTFFYKMGVEKNEKEIQIRILRPIM